MGTDAATIARFWAKVGKGPDCWRWLGWHLPNGYGGWEYGGRLNRQRTTAHRFAYELRKGPIPEGWHVDHLCRNRGCCNPDHLEAVPHGENLRRGYAARGLKTHCVNGHEFTPENTRQTAKQRFCKTCARDRLRKHRAKKAEGRDRWQKTEGSSS